MMALGPAVLLRDALATQGFYDFGVETEANEAPAMRARSTCRETSMLSWSVRSSKPRRASARRSSWWPGQGRQIAQRTRGGGRAAGCLAHSVRRARSPSWSSRAGTVRGRSAPDSSACFGLMTSRAFCPTSWARARTRHARATERLGALRGGAHNRRRQGPRAAGREGARLSWRPPVTCFGAVYRSTPVRVSAAGLGTSTDLPAVPALSKGSPKHAKS